MKTRLLRTLHRPTGQWLWVTTKRSWQTIYYSFDGGTTWAKSKRDAFKLAGSNLEVCK